MSYYGAAGWSSNDHGLTHHISLFSFTIESIVVDSYEPAFFALLFGLVFKEEVSLVWTNVGMLVRGFPSISAYSVIAKAESDWIRKIMIFTLLLASIAQGSYQMYLCFVGISMACVILLANLGSRAWGYMQWHPVQNYGSMEPVVSFLFAVLTGLLFPFLGHRQVESGGKAALESTLKIAMVAAIIFVISDYDPIQKYLVIGSENCSQDWVVLIVGAWWTLATFCSLLVVFRKGRQGIWPEDEEPLLIKDHHSPVGFKVPNLPDFPIDSVLAQRGVFCLNMKFEFALMLVATMCMGGFLCFLSFTDFEDELSKTGGAN